MERNSGVLSAALKLWFLFKNYALLARAYRPMTGAFLPRWRNMGESITPYHFMQPILIPIKQEAEKK